MPSDSRDTGQIEQDCDLWIGLYRESVYNDAVPNEQKGLTELIVRLNRHGDTGTAYLNLVNGYFKEAQKFTFELKNSHSRMNMMMITNK
jgi:replicative DNA helicase